ncbi:MAG: hypothetical protein AAF443_03920 [Chlamydiota bacterium]
MRKGIIKKTLLIALLVMTPLIALGSYLVFKNPEVIVSHVISCATKTPVTVDNIDFHRESFTIQNLIVRNPKEAYVPAAFRAEVIEIAAPYKHYLQRSIVIDKIEMDNIYLDIEFYNEDKTEGNWQSLVANMHNDEKSENSKRKTLIKKLILRHIQVSVILADGKIHRLSPIDRLEFNDITSEEGIPVKEISEIIVRKMIYSVLKDEGLNLIIKVPLKVIKKIFPFL